MDAPVKTPTVALAEATEEAGIMDFVLGYREGKPEFEGYVSISSLAAMIISFKRKYVDTDWYNAGIMAQRILQNDEIESLKKKLKQEEFNHTNTRISWDSTTEERNKLKEENEFLRNRIQIMNSVIHPNE